MRAERGQNNRNIKQLEFITLWLESTVKVVQLLKVNKKSKVVIKSIYTKGGPTFLSEEPGPHIAHNRKDPNWYFVIVDSSAKTFPAPPR